MNKTNQQHKNILKAGKHFDMSFATFADDMENRLKKMGIKIPRSGPRISAHEKGRDSRTLNPSSRLHRNIRR